MTAKQWTRARAARLKSEFRCVHYGCETPLDTDEIREGYATCWRCREKWAGRYMAKKEQDAAA